MVNEKRLIDVYRRERVLERFYEHMVEFGNVEAAKATRAIINGLKIEPIVDAVEVVHGRWEHSESMVLSAKCSKCKGWVVKHSVNELDFNYCPHCGATMDQEESNNE